MSSQKGHRDIVKIFCFVDNLGSGGAQRQLTIIAAELKKRGHIVEIGIYYPQIAPNFASLLAEMEIKVVSFLKQSKFSIMPAWALYNYVNHNNFDLVLAFQETPSLYAEMARIGWKSTRLLVSERNSVPGESQSAKEWIYRQFHRLADSVTTNSVYHAEWLRKKCPWINQKLLTIYNGVDLKKFELVEPKKGSATCKLLAVGRISEQKNVMGLVEALAICRNEKNMDVTVTWVGALNVGASEYYKRVLAEISNRKISAAWQWIEFSNDVHTLFNEHDALILPSLYEGLPNVVCEALASGLPILLSNVCDHPFLVQQAHAGLLFNPGDPADMASTIAGFYRSDEVERNKMRIQGRIFAEKTLDMNLMVNAYEKEMVRITSAL